MMRGPVVAGPRPSQGDAAQIKNADIKNVSRLGGITRAAGFRVGQRRLTHRNPDPRVTSIESTRSTQAPQGNVIKVSYKGTESEYTVDPTTPIFANATGDRSLLLPGAAVFVIASKQDDGKLTSTRLYVEKDGIKPPM